MSEGALDLSISSYEVPSQRGAARPHDQVSSDSGRASTDSTSSDVHDEIKARLLPSSPHLAATSSPHLATSAASHRAPGLSSTASGSHLSGPVTFPSPSHHRDLPEIPSHLQRPISSSVSPPRAPHTEHSGSYSNPNSPVHTATSGGEEDSKPALPADRISDARVAPIRPFKMYPVDPFNVYSSSLMAGAGGSLSPTPVGMQSLYDTSSPSSFPSFPLTPLTSHLLQRKRRAENRENAASSASSSGTSSTTASGAGNSGGAGGGFGGNGISSVSTSSPGSPRDSGSDGEKRMKSSLDVNVKKDDAYWDRRRKNNEAAKRSRDARRQKEEEIAMRAAFLEQENLKLRAQVAILKNETAKLHYMLYNRI